MAPHCVASVIREPTHELDAVHVALLVEITRQDELEQALSDLASDWDGRIEIRLPARWPRTTSPRARWLHADSPVCNRQHFAALILIQPCCQVPRK